MEKVEMARKGSWGGAAITVRVLLEFISGVKPLTRRDASIPFALSYHDRVPSPNRHGRIQRIAVR